MAKIDIHVHTPASRCSMWSNFREAALAIESTVQSGKLDYVCITDHGTVEGYEMLLEYPGLKGKIFPGVEVTIKSHGDLLVFSRDLDYLRTFNQRSYESLEEVSRMFRGRIAVVWAHPYRNSYIADYNGLELVKDIAGLIDGVEVCNGARLEQTPQNRRFAEECSSHKPIAYLGGSDAHAWSILGKAYTEFNGVRSISGIIRAIKERKTQPHPDFQ